MLLSDQRILVLKRRLLEVSREGQALIQEVMKRAMAQEETEEAYHELAHLAQQCLAFLGKLEPGDMVTKEVASKGQHLQAQFRELLTRHKQESREEETEDPPVS